MQPHLLEPLLLTTRLTPPRKMPSLPKIVDIIRPLLPLSNSVTAYIVDKGMILLDFTAVPHRQKNHLSRKHFSYDGSHTQTLNVHVFWLKLPIISTKVMV